MKVRNFLVATTVAAGLVVAPLATSASASGEVWTNGYVQKTSTCSTAFTRDCILKIYTPGYPLSTVYIHENSPVYNCHSIGIPYGTRLGASGVMDKLRANRHYVNGAWYGAKVTTQTKGTEPSYVRCNY